MAAVELVSDLGMIARCVTNGYWAKSLTHGRARLEPLVRAGLKELNISTGDFHQRWVPQRTVANAATLSVDLGLSTVIMVEMQRERRVTAATLSQESGIAALLAPEPRVRIIESPWMPMSADEVIEQDPDRVLSRNTLHMRGGCKSVLETVVLTPHRQFGFCCGLSREKIPELNTEWVPGTLASIFLADPESRIHPSEFGLLHPLFEPRTTQHSPTATNRPT